MITANAAHETTITNTNIGAFPPGFEKGKTSNYKLAQWYVRSREGSDLL
jgi:hypothetical protein